MATDERTTSGHPVPADVRALGQAVSELADRPLLSLDAAGTRESLIEVAALGAQVDALRLALAAHGETVQVAEQSGATSTATWWAVATRQNRNAAAGLVRLAQALDRRWLRVAAGCRAGAVSLEQARVIVHALEDLPDELGAELLVSAEEMMVDLAAEHDPAHLRILGHAILEHLASDLAAEHERKRIEADEARADDRTKLTMTSDGHGVVHGRFTVPAAQGGLFRKVLTAIASPHRNRGEEDPTGDPEKAGDSTAESARTAGRLSKERLGEAFCELIETLDSERLPRTGGTSATGVIITDLDYLRHGVGSAVLDTGEHLSPGQARRMLCRAKILPVVMGGRSVVLDAGRRRRLHSEVQRILRGIIDGGCAAEGCDWPPGMCECHHDDPWSEGGATDVEHARLLCPHHHRRIHDHRYEATVLADHQVRFHRRT